MNSRQRTHHVQLAYNRTLPLLKEACTGCTQFTDMQLLMLGVGLSQRRDFKPTVRKELSWQNLTSRGTPHVHWQRAGGPAHHHPPKHPSCLKIQPAAAPAQTKTAHKAPRPARALSVSRASVPCMHLPPHSRAAQHLAAHQEHQQLHTGAHPRAKNQVHVASTTQHALRCLAAAANLI
jgi:hypothetical protein